jgi:hypothetical protein
MDEKFRTARHGVVFDDADPRDLDLDMADLMRHVSRAEKLFKPIQPSNLEFELIRAKEANRQARELLGLD